MQKITTRQELVEEIKPLVLNYAKAKGLLHGCLVLEYQITDGTIVFAKVIEEERSKF